MCIDNEVDSAERGSWAGSNVQGPARKSRNRDIGIFGARGEGFMGGNVTTRLIRLSSGPSAARVLLSMASVCVVSPLGSSGGWKQTSAPIAAWQCVASSADGRTLAAAIKGGGIYTSTNSGVDWRSNTVPSGAWRSITCSTNGSRLAAAMEGDGIYTSPNFGRSWVKTSAPNKAWSSLGASADAKILVAGVAGGAIYKSSNFGTNWTALTAPLTNWDSIALSRDAKTLVAGCFGVIGSLFGDTGTGTVYTSTNSGTSWRRSSLPDQVWTLVTASADGKRLSAAGFVLFLGQPYPSQMYISTNSGSTWFASGLGFLSDDPVTSVVSSADGKVLFASENFWPGSLLGTGGTIVGSLDGGETWDYSPAAPELPWTSLACSSECAKLVAVVNGGGVYTWEYQPRLNLTCSQTNVLISWLASSLATGFMLQQNPDLLSTNWTEVTAAAVDVGTARSITLATPTNNAFYRLKK